VVEPEPVGEFEGSDGKHDVGEAEVVVQKLDDLAGTDGTDVGDGAGECPKNRSRLIDDCLLTTHDNCHRAVDGALPGSAHWSVQDGHALLDRSLLDRENSFGRDRRVHGDNGSGPHPGQQAGLAVAAEQDVEDVGVTLNANADEVAVSAKFGSRDSNGCPRIGQESGCRRPSAPDLQGVSAGKNPLGDRLALVAETHETNRRDCHIYSLSPRSP
jgi:hypothetical protein